MKSLSFIYDIDKDVINFMKSAKSVNAPHPTNLHQLFIDKHGPIEDEKKVKEFIEDYIKDIDIESIRLQFEKDWRKIEMEFVDRAEKIFGVSLDNEMTAYLTTNSRCTYSIDNNFFFLRIKGKDSNVTIMHELFHFYTYHALYNKLKEKGVDDKGYNNIKESLTVLLNVEFTDLLDGHIDQGYPQHQDMRQRITNEWGKEKDLFNVVMSVNID